MVFFEKCYVKCVRKSTVNFIFLDLTFNSIVHGIDNNLFHNLDLPNPLNRYAACLYKVLETSHLILDII